MKVSVSILKEENNFKEAINRLNVTDCDYIHLDIMDNTFTKTESKFKLSDFKDIVTNKKYDIHIMSTDLEYQVDEAIKLNPEYITIHVETGIEFLNYVTKIRKNHIKVGLAINPNTNIDEFIPFFDSVNLVLIMSVIPGKSGQSFIMNTIDTLKKIPRNRERYIVSVDGGINNETYEYVKDYVDMVVSGSYVTSSDNYQERIDNLRK